MPPASPNSRTRCANLAERQKDEKKQTLAIYSAGTENREHGRNKRPDCKTKTGTKPPDAETETAAQAGPLNGGDKSEKHSGAFKENSYHAGGPAATRAGLWYAENRYTCPRPVVPALRRMFGLSTLEAVQAIRVANGVQR